MATGFIQISRSLFEHPAWIDATPEQKVLLLTIIEKANYKPMTWLWNGEQVSVDRGQFITSVEKLVVAGGRGMTTAKVRTALKRFEKYGILTTKTTSQSTLVTVENYDILTCGPDEDSKRNDKDLANDSQTDDKRIATTNKYNKSNNGNKGDNSFFKNVPTELRVNFLEWNDMRIAKQAGLRSESAVNRFLKKLEDCYPGDYEKQNAVICQALDGGYLDFKPLMDDTTATAKKNSRLSYLDDFYAMAEEWANGGD